jgi:hypothetical protein
VHVLRSVRKVGRPEVRVWACVCIRKPFDVLWKLARLSDQRAEREKAA